MPPQRPSPRPARSPGLAWRVAGTAAVKVALIIGIGIALLDTVAEHRRAEGWVAHSQQVLTAAQLAERQVIDLETGVRAYAATADRSFLAPTRAAERELPGQLTELATLVGTDRELSARAAGLRRAVAANVAFTRRLMDGPIPRGRALDRWLHAGKRQVDALRRRFTGFDAVASRTAARRAATGRASESFLETFTVASIGGILVLIGAFALFILHSVVRPLRRGVEAMDRVRAGERDLRLDAATAAEPGQLAVAFNAMVEQLARTERELREAAERHATVLEAAHNAYVSVDRHGTVLAWNCAAWELFGYTAPEAIGRELAVLIIPPQHREAHRRGIERFQHAGISALLDRPMEVVACRADGREVEVELVISASWQDGAPVFHAFISDLTERRAAEKDRQLMAAIASRTPDAILAFDADLRTLHFNRGAERIYGHRAEDLIGRSLLEMNPPGPVREVARDLLQRILAGEELQIQGLSRRRADGSEIFVDIASTPLLDGAGRVIGGATVIHDVTEQRRLAGRLRDRERELADAQALAGLGAWEWDVGDDRMRWNDQLCAIFGVSSGWRPTLADVNELVHPEERRSVEARFAAFSNTTDDLVEQRIIRPDGELRYIHSRRNVRRGPDGEITQLHGIVVDVTDRKALEARLETLAATDPLTGLANRRALEERLAGELSRADRHERPLALVVLDLDHFKAVNDTYGHPVGDAVLCEAARRLGTIARAGELVARIGGEEFAWVLPDADGAGAWAAAERARRTISSLPFARAGRITVSAGVCALEDLGVGADADLATALLTRADEALYLAKSAGRNRVMRLAAVPA